MAKRKDMAGKDDEKQVRGRPGPPSQARSEEKRRPAREGGGAAKGSVPRVGKHDASRGDTPGDGLH
ncbi:MAG TPA: hypothetical protein VF611_13375 [Pyrinomonadaceae bacterium]|jgi:hypothetical protein